MLSVSSFIHDYNAHNLKRIMFYLISVLIFGLVVPVFVVNFNFEPVIELLLSCISLIGFFIFLGVTIYTLYVEITSKNIYEL